jgi:hypothetical protein
MGERPAQQMECDLDFDESRAAALSGAGAEHAAATASQLQAATLLLSCLESRSGGECQGKHCIDECEAVRRVEVELCARSSRVQGEHCIEDSSPDTTPSEGSSSREEEESGYIALESAESLSCVQVPGASSSVHEKQQYASAQSIIRATDFAVMLQSSEQTQYPQVSQVGPRSSAGRTQTRSTNRLADAARRKLEAGSRRVSSAASPHASPLSSVMEARHRNAGRGKYPSSASR